MATIIKQSAPVEQRSGRPSHASPFHFDDMGGRVDEYLSTVRQEAAKIVQEAHRKAEAIRHDAEAAGRRAAQEAIEKILDERVGQRLQTLLPAVEALLTELHEARSDWQRHWEVAAVRLATAIASRIVRREIEQDPQITLDLISEALRLASGADELVVYLSPADHESLGSQAEQLAKSLSRLAPATILADEAMEPGGCRVATRFGEIDLQIQSQLERIAEELT